MGMEEAFCKEVFGNLTLLQPSSVFHFRRPMIFNLAFKNATYEMYQYKSFLILHK